MDFSTLWKKVFVMVTGYKPKIFSEEEKKQVMEKMAAENRAQDRNIRTCDKELIEGLELEEVSLPECGGWMVSRSSNPHDCIIYYIHGGGFTNSCTKSRMTFVSYLVKKFGYDVFSIDYRLAPEYKAPCQVNDCIDGYKYLHEKYSPDRIVVIGESAGGNLAVCLALKARDMGLPLPKSLFPNSMASQFSEYTESYRRCSLKTDFIVTMGIMENMMGVYYNEENVNDPYISPLYADLRGLPHVLLTASNCECLLDDSVMMYEKLREAGVDAELKTYDGLCHAFIISPQMKDVVKKAYPDLEEYLKEQLPK